MTAFLIVTFLCGHTAALLLNNFYKPPQGPRSIYKRIEYEVKKIISGDTRTFESMVYIGTKENQLWVGAATTEETSNIKFFIFDFKNDYSENDMFNHIEKKGLNNVEVAQESKEKTPSYNPKLVPSELEQVKHAPKKQTAFLELNGNTIRFECGTTEDGAYSFVFDETNEETLNCNFYTDEKANIIYPIWMN